MNLGYLVHKMGSVAFHSGTTLPQKIQSLEVQELKFWKVNHNFNCEEKVLQNTDQYIFPFLDFQPE